MIRTSFFSSVFLFDHKNWKNNWHSTPKNENGQRCDEFRVTEIGRHFLIIVFYNIYNFKIMQPPPEMIRIGVRYVACLVYVLILISLHRVKKSSVMHWNHTPARANATAPRVVHDWRYSSRTNVALTDAGHHSLCKRLISYTDTNAGGGKKAPSAKTLWILIDKFFFARVHSVR